MNMDKKIIGLLAFMLVMAPAFSAAALTSDETYGCGSNSETFTLTGAGYGATLDTNLTYDAALGSTSTIALTSCTTGTWVDGSTVVSDGAGAFVCLATVYANDYGTHTLAMTDNATATDSVSFSGKCYEVTDLIGQGVDIAGQFMNALVDQSGNIALLIILGLIVTLLVGVIAAVGTIFVVFKMK